MDWFISHFDPLFIVLGSLSGVLGLAVIYSAWRQKGRRPLQLNAGWLLVVVGSALWIQAARFDTGLALAITLWMLVALAIVLANGQWRGKVASANEGEAKANRPRGANARHGDHAADDELNVAAPRINPPSLAVIKRALINFFLAGPLAFAFALSVGSLVFPLAPWQEATRIIVGAMLTIMIWAIAMVWVVASSERMRNALVLTVGTIVSVLMLQWLH